MACSCDDIVFSKLVETYNNSKCLIGYLNSVIRPLVMILPKLRCAWNEMSRYGKMFKDKNGDKNENNELMSLHIDDDKLLEKYKTNAIKIEDLKDIELDNLPA